MKAHDNTAKTFPITSVPLAARIAFQLSLTQTATATASAGQKIFDWNDDFLVGSMYHSAGTIPATADASIFCSKFYDVVDQADSTKTIDLKAAYGWGKKSKCTW